MSLDIREAQGVFTKAVLAKVNLTPKVDAGFKNFFSDEILSTRGFEFWVEKLSRRIAVDVEFEEKGNTIRRDKASQKMFIPPYFNDKFNYSALEQFEPIFGGNGVLSENVYQEMVQRTADGVQEIINAFERAQELQRAQALLTGIVTCDKGDNVNFQREAASLVAYNAAHGWAITTVDPEEIIISGINFLIRYGLVDGGQIFNIIMGTSALQAFKNNPIRQDQGDIKDQMYMNLSTGAPIAGGLVPQGSYSAGNFRVNIWGYEGVYNAPSTGTLTTIMDPKKIVILPNTVPFKQVYCGTPGWNGDPYTTNAFPTIVKAKYNFYKVRDIEGCKEELGVRCATVPSLFNVNSVYTAQVIS